MRLPLLFVAFFTPTLAVAGPCDSLVQRAGSASGATLVAAFEAIAKCSPDAAKAAFPDLMLRARDLETLVPLALAAVHVDAYVPVWDMMEKVPYEFRQDLAEGIGAACATEPKVVPFLQGAYVAVKGADFASWGPALEACADPTFGTWLEGVLAEPPASTYNERYNAVVSAWVRSRGLSGLAALEKGAVVAGSQGGPFGTLLDAMARVATPSSMRGTADPAAVAAVEGALVRVAKAVPPESARAVADRLATSGNVTAAAALLPSIYPDAAAPDGKVRWAAAAIEACEGEAVVHWTTWTEAPTRVDVLAPAQAALASLKPKLKCTGVDGWTYRASEAPVSEPAVDAWVAGLVKGWNDQGFKTKAKEVAVSVGG